MQLALRWVICMHLRTESDFCCMYGFYNWWKVFTARYGLIPYIKQMTFSLWVKVCFRRRQLMTKGLIVLLCPIISVETCSVISSSFIDIYLSGTTLNLPRNWVRVIRLVLTVMYCGSDMSGELLTVAVIHVHSVLQKSSGLTVDPWHKVYLQMCFIALAALTQKRR